MADATRRLVMAGGLGMSLFGAKKVLAAEASAFDYSLPSIEGGTLDLSTLRGRALLVVNTASFCGFTRQYAGLQALHDKYEPRGLTVIGVPSNDFFQESKDAAAVKEFCDTQFGITFPMSVPEKVTGSGATPLFRFLAEKGGGSPRWNFYKYLVARDGRHVERFSSVTGPESDSLIAAIEKALAASA
ncbi:glutathione peroxidase [Acetobacteraceae bacterium H6797]|nr:glutathione peroxidase [Acetobacteraceae bacterium H6797]